MMSLTIIELSGFEDRGCRPDGADGACASTGSNRAAIARIFGQPRMVQVPRVEDLEAGAAHLEEVIPWLELE